MKFFAYGTNVLLAKMMSLVTFAQAIGLAELSGYQLIFNKKSHKDDSGLANLTATQKATDKVYGNLYEVSDSYLSTLELAEGIQHGYHTQKVTVLCQGENISATIFLCDDPAFLQNNLKPFDWYKAMIVRGLERLEAPADYTQKVKKMEDILDVDVQRARIHLCFLE